MFKFSAKAVFIGLLLLTFNLTVNVSQLKAQQTYQIQQVVGNLVFPTYLTTAKDNSGRLFIVQKNGVIKIYNPTSGAVSDFLDISAKVLSANTVNSERGLLGLAFHPQYLQNRRFFVYYTRQPDGAIQVSEFKVSVANPNVADATEKLIITIPHPNFSNHNGGMIEFGPDGYLYFGTGDGGSANDPPANAQNINVLLGKMLRIDVNVAETANPPYAIPPDNPFAGATPGADEIYAYGLRNPWRFSFDRGGSRQLYIGDVGQDQIEEIDIGQRGANYGWRVYEANQCTNLDPQLCAGGTSPITQTPPIFTYTHTNGRCSITGGYIYRGTRGTFPQGAYIYADYCTGEIWSLVSGVNTLVLDTDFLITSFGEDERGEIYFTSNNATAGTVQRIVNPNAVARARVADFDGDGRTDVSVARDVSNNKIWFVQTANNNFRSLQFGSTGDVIAPGDYDGDGRTDFAIYRPSQGVWYSLDSSTNTLRGIQWGNGNNEILPADYDGDGKTDYAVWYNGYWYIYNSATNSPRIINYGFGSDVKLPADYDGDGRADLAVFRSTDGYWYIQRSRDGSTAIPWGLNGDKPVPGDYDADGKVDPAVFRARCDVGGCQAIWYVLQSSNNQLLARAWGTIEDIPVPGDYDGDGRTDFAVTRNQSGNKVWYILNSGNSAFRAEFFGTVVDIAVPSVDNP